ncbi:MAG: hypothetical protein ACD_69C00341G0002 [uncultured bacterium]|nr:MAG: hypothetical protein ACD_69C00341G0002 [uncultured bacterium]HBC71169.1 hypothetical protein [Coxiellaceae bacterium]
MSLINKMLNELEKNKQDDQVRQEALSGITPSIIKQKYTLDKKVIYLITIIVILIISIAIAWHYRTKATTNAPKTKPITTKEQPPLPAITLQSITLEQKDKRTNLDFILSAPTQYLIEHSTEQQLSITLNNTGLLGNLPVALENSFIITLNTKQDKNNTINTLTLLPGTKVDELQMIDKPQPHLHLAFSNSQLSNSTMSKVPTPVSPEQQIAERYQDIQNLLAQNKIDEAIPKLHLFIGDFPNHLQAREMLVSLLIKEGRFQKANDVLAAGLNKFQGYIPFIKLKAHILIKQNEINTAIDLLQRHISNIDTNDVEYLAMLAALYQKQGQFMQAAGLYDQLTKIQPQKTIWWIGLGTSLENAGQKNAAREAYQLAYNNSDVPPDLGAFLNDKIKK